MFHHMQSQAGFTEPQVRLFFFSLNDNQRKVTWLSKMVIFDNVNINVSNYLLNGNHNFIIIAIKSIVISLTISVLFAETGNLLNN